MLPADIVRYADCNLTRFVQTLLDRKDRMSTAVGLEVRVPFCDRRPVEYVYNVPWLAALLADRSSPVLPLLDVPRCRALLERPLGPVSRPDDRGSLETALWLDAWMRLHGVTLEL